MQRTERTDTGGIERMGLGNPEALAVVFGLSTRAARHGQAGGLQSLEQRPAGGIHSSGIPEWRLGLCLDAAQQRRFVLKEDLNRLVAFALVAGATGQGQVADPIRAAPALGVDVFDLEGDALGAAVGAGAVPFLQQVLLAGGRMLVQHGDVTVAILTALGGGTPRGVLLLNSSLT